MGGEGRGTARLALFVAQSPLVFNETVVQQIRAAFAQVDVDAGRLPGGCRPPGDAGRFIGGGRHPARRRQKWRVVARVVHGRADSPASVRDLADVAALLPNDAEAPQFSVALMELGATVCTARTPRCGLCPLSTCAWRAAGFPPADAPARRPQRYAGTDRQVRGRLLDVLRANASPVDRAQLDVAWTSDTAQRDRALHSLLTDGLVEQTADGRFALSGEAGEPGPPSAGVN